MTTLLDVGSAGIGLAGSLIDGFGARKKQKRGFDTAMARYLGAAGQQQTGYAQARSGMQQAAGTLAQGYNNAHAALSGVGQEAYRHNKDLAKLAVGGANASAVNRGLFNSTVGQQMQAQAAYQVMRASGSVADRLAAHRTGLFAQQANALANQQNMISQTYAQQGNAALNAAGQLFQAQGQQPAFGNAALWGQVGGFGGLLSDYFNKDEG